MRETGQPSAGDIEPVFDREDFQRRIGLPEELFDEFLTAYVEDATESLKRMDAAIAAQDRDGLRHSAHALKGSSGNMSMVEMLRLGEEIERLALQAPAEELRAAADRLRQALARVRALATRRT